MGKSVPHLHWPPSSLVLSLKIFGDNIPKASGEWSSLRISLKLMMIQNRKIDVVPSASALIIKPLKELPRDRKKKGGELSTVEISEKCIFIV